MININWSTLLLQIANFVVMVVILTRFFFKPVIKALDERSKRVTSALEEAEKREKEAQDMHAEYETRLREANEWVANMKQKAQEELEQTKQQLIAEAQSEIQQLRTKAEGEIEESRQHAILQHRRELGQLVTTLSARLIREAGSDAFQSATVTEFLKRLPAALARQPLLADAYQHEPDVDQIPNVELVSANDLDPDTVSQIQDQVQAAIGLPVFVKHKVDPALVAGAVLRLGDTLIDGSLEGQLQSLRTRYLNELDKSEYE